MANHLSTIEDKESNSVIPGCSLDCEDIILSVKWICQAYENIMHDIVIFPHIAISKISIPPSLNFEYENINWFSQISDFRISKFLWDFSSFWSCKHI